MSNSDFYKLVDWVSEETLCQCSIAWENFFSKKSSAKLTEADRPTLRDILLSIYKPFIHDYSEKKNLVTMLTYDWKLRFIENMEWSDNEADYIAGSGELTSHVPKKLLAIRVLAEKHLGIIGCPGLSKADFVDQYSKANIYPPGEKFSVKTPSLPCVLAMIDLSASDLEIQDKINYWRTQLKIDHNMDSKGRKKSSGRRPGFKVEKHFFDALILFQLGKSEAEVFGLISGSNSGLSKSTFHAQVIKILNFVDPNSIGHKNGKIKAEFIK